MNAKRIQLIVVGAVGLVLIYVFQSYLDFYSVFFRFSAPQYIDPSSVATVEPLPFVVNKTLRYVANDLCAISLIYGLFYEKKYARFAFAVMIFGMLVLLPIYLALYINRPEGYSSMLSHLHRIVMNPVLMMLLIPAFYYQKKVSAEKP